VARRVHQRLVAASLEMLEEGGHGAGDAVHLRKKALGDDRQTHRNPYSPDTHRGAVKTSESSGHRPVSSGYGTVTSVTPTHQMLSSG
jgi:hypothetical protein